MSSFPRKGSGPSKKYDDPKIHPHNSSNTLLPNTVKYGTTTSTSTSTSPSLVRRFRGIFGGSAQKKRKDNGVLPITSGRKSHRPTSVRRYHPHSSSPCSSFLMGGSYYPGKDKKRRILSSSRNAPSEKKLWYRVFCSSWHRILLSWCIVWFIGIWYFASTPTHEWKPPTIPSGDVVEPPSGKNNKPPPSDEDNKPKKKNGKHKFTLPLFQGKKQGVLVPPPIPNSHLLSVKEKKKFLEESNKEDTLYAKWLMDTISKIVPDFVHRNDPDYVSPNNAEEENDEVEEDHQPVDKERIMTLSDMDTTGSCPPLPSTTPISISLVIQCTADRLWIVQHTCQRWNDPIIVVLYFPAPKSSSQSDSYQSMFASCPNVTILPHYATADTPYYPINKLRNIGMNAVKTTHFLVLDADFIPSSNLPKIISSSPQISEFMRKDNQIMVVPAFERSDKECRGTIEECQEFMEGDENFIPKTFEGLQTCVEDKQCDVFQARDNWEGHYTTRSHYWLQRNWYEPNKNEPQHILCFHSPRYEPYAIIRYCPTKMPFYDERFHGYGKNKIQYIAHLRFLHYEFRILPEGFVVHHPHPESESKRVWNNVEEEDLHWEMDELYPKFLRELVKRYGKPKMQLCGQE